MDRNEVPVKYRKLFDKAMTGHSLTTAVKLNCLQCVGWLKEEVRNCTGQKNCPLWLYRPYRISPSAKKREMAPQTGEKPKQMPLTNYEWEREGSYRHTDIPKGLK